MRESGVYQKPGNEPRRSAVVSWLPMAWPTITESLGIYGAVLSTALGIIGGISKFPERPRDRFFSPGELDRLWTVVTILENAGVSWPI